MLLIQSENECGRLKEDLKDERQTIEMLTEARDATRDKVTYVPAIHLSVHLSNQWNYSDW